jgi:hypothetical protein
LSAMCAYRGDTYTEAAHARVDRIIAAGDPAGGLSVIMEAMMNHPVLKKDEISAFHTHQPDKVITIGVLILLMMSDDDVHAQGHEERRVRLRKAGVLQVLVPVVAAFTKAEIEAGMQGEIDKVMIACQVLDCLVGTKRLVACIEGEDPLSDMLTELRIHRKKRLEGIACKRRKAYLW